MCNMNMLAEQLRVIFNDLLPKGNVLYFAPCPLNEGLGGSARLGNMVDILRKLRFHVYLVSYAPSDRFRLRLSRTLPCDYLRLSVDREAPSWRKSMALLVIVAYGLLWGWKCRYVFAHAPSVVSGFPALLVAKLYGKPLIVDHMDIKDPQTPQWLYDFVLRKADMVFCISRVLMRGIQEGKAVYIPPFVNCGLGQEAIE